LSQYPQLLRSFGRPGERDPAFLFLRWLVAFFFVVGDGPAPSRCAGICFKSMVTPPRAGGARERELGDQEPGGLDARMCWSSLDVRHDPVIYSVRLAVREAILRNLKPRRPIKQTGGGRPLRESKSEDMCLSTTMTATAKDPYGNAIGLLYNPFFRVGN
jgi:hypothetical protein